MNAVHGITMFADMSDEEFNAYRGVKFEMKDVYKDSEIALPAVVEEVKYNKDKIVDWTGKYTSYGVKNQGYCGSCWAFSAVSQVESDSIRAGIWQPKSDSTEDGYEYLAVQQVVSCDVVTSGHDIPNDVACYGCEGGWPTSAYEYIHLAGGIALESEYSYDSTEGETHDCKRSKAKPANFVVTVDNYYSILSEKDMVNYVLAKGIDCYYQLEILEEYCSNRSSLTYPFLNSPLIPSPLLSLTFVQPIPISFERSCVRYCMRRRMEFISGWYRSKLLY